MQSLFFPALSIIGNISCIVCVLVMKFTVDSIFWPFHDYIEVVASMEEGHFSCLLNLLDILEEILLRVCCSMLLCLRGRLLVGDFTSNLIRLQHYPSVDITNLLKVADDLRN